ncbi:MAG: 16S rRNA (guanine(966)-N(2))-methyltransferase RsmD [Actinomycetota bacterium]|nr:16S rRNA (guanine(966)-N(2))-methyltransferase RsmD [Actinomycetota bacterium]
MRVVSGSAGGRRLISPEGRTTRPTSERTREATFNALGSLGAVVDATVVDLFAGSGALGIEALSRGASAATFVESDRAAIAAIHANLATCGLAQEATVVASTVDRFLADAARNGVRFDLALVDPPYDFATWDDLLAAIPADLVAAEAPSAVSAPEGWEVLRSRRYGRAWVTLLERR